MHCDGFADALADYLEGDASPDVHAAVDAHAASCAACRQMLADLSAIQTDAAALPALVPSRDLWAGIAERIDTRVIPLGATRAIDIPRRRGWIRPAAAAAALVVLTAGITHFLTRAALAPVAPAVVAASALPATGTPTAEFVSTATERVGGRMLNASHITSAEPAMLAAEPVFDGEISKLRKLVRERRSQLDPKTVAVLEQSVAVIDSAIAQSRAALSRDPASAFLATQLNRSLEKKVELLRTAASLPSRT
jgi:anti-sigma factor RsiW